MKSFLEWLLPKRREWERGPQGVQGVIGSIGWVPATDVEPEGSLYDRKEQPPTPKPVYDPRNDPNREEGYYWVKFRFGETDMFGANDEWCIAHWIHEPEGFIYNGKPTYGFFMVRDSEQWFWDRGDDTESIVEIGPYVVPPDRSAPVC